MNDSINYLSAESLVTLKKERDTLKDVTIPDIAKRIDEAKQQGDLSENAEYHQAREDMSWAQGRLQELDQIINNSEVIVKHDTNVVSLGSTIKNANTPLSARKKSTQPKVTFLTNPRSVELFWGIKWGRGWR